MGEPGYEKPYIDENGNQQGGKFKIGNGLNKWSELPYFATEIEYITILDSLPENGNYNQIYRVNNQFYIWNEEKFELLNQSDIDDKNNIIITNRLPEEGDENKIYRINQTFYFWNTEEKRFEFLTQVTSSDGSIILPQKDYIITVEDFPEVGDENVLYKLSQDQALYHFNSINQEYEIVNNNQEVLEQILELKNIDNSLFNSVEEINTNITSLYSADEEINAHFITIEEDLTNLSLETRNDIDNLKSKDQSLEEQISSLNNKDNEILEEISNKVTYFEENINTLSQDILNNSISINELSANIENEINTLKESIGSINFDNEFEQIQQEIDEIKLNTNSITTFSSITDFPAIGDDEKLYKDLSTQIIYYWNSNENNYQTIEVDIPDSEGINNIVIVDELPLTGQSDFLYKVKESQKFFYWNENLSAFFPLASISLEDLPEVKGGIEVYNNLEDLPESGVSDILYKVLENEKVYTWNGTSGTYKPVGNIESSGGGSVIVYDTLADFPEIGEVFNLYRALDTQLLYIYNPNTKIYDLLGQGNGTGAEEGYNISLQRKNDYLFAVTKNDAAELRFIYTSIDSEGIPDGPGLATLFINDVRKASYAIPQGKEESLDISKLLSLGTNSIILKIENSEGAEKAKELRWQITLVDLTISTSVAPMTTQSTEVLIPIEIQGTGTKTIRYYLDGKEINHETVTVDNVPYRLPVQPAGPHIIEIQAECEVNNITIYSNVITLGMMFTDDHMVNTQILSTFNQKKVKQGEIIEIPYLVYNPLLETSQIVQSIYYENGELFAEPKVLYKSRTPDSWIIQNYPSGKITFEMIAYSANTEQNYRIAFEVEVEPVEFDLETIRDNSLIFEFSAEGRSNAEENPNQWSYYSPITDETYIGSFERFAWASSDGWITSDYGETALRLLPKNKFTIPFYPFKEDKLSTGFTLEMELETRDVANQDTTVLSCFSDGIGFQVGAQQVFFNTSLSETSMYFKEDERVRITIVVEPMTSGSRVVYMFINGIICSTIQYDANDHTKQTTPVPITIGSDECGLDLYKIRFYLRNFNFREQIENYICDRPTVAERIALKQKNDIYDISRNITIGSLPPEIPYLVLQSDSLPQSKEDSEKKKGRAMYFVDKLNPKRSFSAQGVDISVQGTSSAGYPIKNFKVKFKKGIIYNDGSTASGYPIVNEDDLVSECLCLKADYASSEQANNVVLVDYYDELVRDYFLTPPQEENPKVRTGISGRPIVVFWENTVTGEIKFQGQYNMNNDKSNENVFGFDREKYPRLECWEFCNNTSNLCLFKDSDYEKTYIDSTTGEEKLSWKSDFEARYPDLDDPYSDYTQLKRLTDWIVSTRQDLATNNLLTDPETGENIIKTYNDISYDKDTAEYRLAKFKNEFDNYLIKDPVIFYYIFTEVFLMIDSRAKNMFLTTFDGEHWFPIPYDFDTAIGINNEGKLVFDYDLEDTDKIGNNEGKLVGVYNGQESALWINVRDAFKQEIRAMYAELRANGRDEDNDIPGKFSFEVINEKMNAHQQNCWPENIWNEDAKLKYVDVFLNTGKNYLEMCQGNKKTQREWWLFNTFKYRDSKYRAGDAVKGSKYEADLRIYRPGSITVTPYQHLWPRIDYTRSEAYMAIKKGKKNIPVLLENRMDYANDTETYIASSDRISSFGDLSHLMAGTVDFSAASKLQNIILGSHEEGYENVNLSSLTLGNNRLLNYLNVENCTALTSSIDASQCFNLETVDAIGSNLTSITLPEGGHLKDLNLPETIIDITIKNQHMIDNFNIKKVYNSQSEKDEYANLTTIVIDDVPNLPIEDLLLDSPKLNCVRIVNTSWNVSSEQALKDIYDKITQDFFMGKDANNKLTDDAILTGEVHIDKISDEFLEILNDRFPELVIYEQGKAKFFIRYLNYDKTLLHKQAVAMGGNAIDPVTAGIIETPTQPGTEDTKYEYSHWSSLPTNVTGPQNIIAQYDTYYRVQFLNGDNNVVNTQWIIKNGNAVDPILSQEIEIPEKTSDVKYHYGFLRWVEDFSVITGPLDVTSEYSHYLREYTVKFYNDKELLQESQFYYGSNAEYHGNTSEIKKTIANEPSPYYTFSHWSPALTEPIEGETSFYAQYLFDGYIKDSWSTIAANVAEGDLSAYGYSGKKTLNLNYTYEGQNYQETIDLEIIDKNHDVLENGIDKASLTFKGELSIKGPINKTSKEYQGNNNRNAGGWTLCDMRKWLNEDFFNNLPSDLKASIKAVKKISDDGLGNQGDLASHLLETVDKIFIPSLEELNISRNDFTVLGQGDSYVMFTDASSRKTDYPYWTRSTYPIQHLWCIIDGGGFEYFAGGNSSYKVVFCFCV